MAIGPCIPTTIPALTRSYRHANFFTFDASNLLDRGLFVSGRRYGGQEGRNKII